MKKFFLIILFFCQWQLSFAGWHIVYMYQDSNSDYIATTWIQFNSIRESNGDFDFIYNEDTKMVTVLSNRFKLYFNSPLETFINDSKHILSQNDGSIIQNIDPKNQKIFQDYANEICDAVKKKPNKNSAFKLIETKEEKLIDSMISHKYLLVQGKKLIENIWQADTPKVYTKDLLTNLMQIKKLFDFQQIETFYSSEIYIDFLLNGVITEVSAPVSTTGNGRSKFKVIESIEQQNDNPEIFLIPSDYKEIDSITFFSMMLNAHFQNNNQ